MSSTDLLIPLIQRLEDVVLQLPTATDQLALRSDQLTDTDLSAARIAKLDNLDAQVSSVRIDPPAVLVGAGGEDVTSTPTAPRGLRTFDASQSGIHSTGWQDFLSVSGAGYIQLAAVSLDNTGTQDEADGRIQLVVDGVTILEVSASTLTQTWARIVSLVGHWDFVASSCGFGFVPFATSFSIRWYNASSGSNYQVNAFCHIRYYRTS